MGTRGTIVVTGLTPFNKTVQTTRLYKNNDAHPAYVLGMLFEAISASQKQVKKENDRFKGSRQSIMSESQLIGQIIGADTSVYGMNTHIDATFETAFETEHLDQDHCFIEWSYLVDIEAKTVTVFNGAGDVADPTSYAQRLYEQYQADSRESIKSDMALVESLGFKIVMPKAKKVSKAKRAPKAKAKAAKLSVVSK
jgi:hypothetical protein